MAEIVVPYSPRQWAKPFHETFKRFIALCLHRRAGKTTALVNHSQRSATDEARERTRLTYLAPNLTVSEIDDLFKQERFYGIVLPTYKQAKYVAWDMLKFYARPIPGIVTNESDLIVKYPGGGKVGLFGADNPDSLRGIPFWGLSFDEYSQQPPNIFSEVLSKSLADHLGYAIFAGTIKGKNQLFRTYKSAEKTPEEWFSLWQDIDVSLKTEVGGTIKLLQIALEDDRKLVAQGLMTQEEFDQEWYLSPEAAVKGAFYASQLALARKQNRIRLVPYDLALKVHTVFDLGVGSSLVIGFFQRVGNEVKLIDIWQGSGNDGVVHALQAIQRKPYIYGKHFFPHDVKAREETTGKTRQQYAEDMGFKVDFVPEVSVDNGIDTAQRMFSRLWINEPECQIFLDAIAEYHREWDEKKGDFRDTPYHNWASHFADVLRYAALVEDKMTNEESKPYIPPPNTPISEFETGSLPTQLYQKPSNDSVSEYEGAESEKPWQWKDAMNL